MSIRLVPLIITINMLNNTIVLSMERGCRGMWSCGHALSSQLCTLVAAKGGKGFAHVQSHLFLQESSSSPQASL